MFDGSSSNNGDVVGVEHLQSNTRWINLRPKWKTDFLISRIFCIAQFKHRTFECIFIRTFRDNDLHCFPLPYIT